MSGSNGREQLQGAMAGSNGREQWQGAMAGRNGREKWQCTVYRVSINTSFYPVWTVKRGATLQCTGCLLIPVSILYRRSGGGLLYSVQGVH